MTKHAKHETSSFRSVVGQFRHVFYRWTKIKCPSSLSSLYPGFAYYLWCFHLLCNYFFLFLSEIRYSSANDFVYLHTCEPFLMDMREIWFSFQGDWSLHQGDYSTAFLTRRFKLFSVKLERNFKQYMNYSALCFKFTLKLTKISTKYIKTERFQCN